MNKEGCGKSQKRLETVEAQKEARNKGKKGNIVFNLFVK